MRYLAIAVVIACGTPKKAPAPPTPEPAPPVATPEAKPPPPPPPTPAEAFLAECRAPLRAAWEAHRALVNHKESPSDADILDGLNEVARFASNAGNKAGLIKAVHPDKTVRDAANVCEQEVQKFVSELMLDKAVYDLVAHVETSKLDAEAKRFVATTLRDYRRAGVDLDDAKRARIKAIDDEVTQLAQKFQQGVAEDTRYIEVKDPARLGGMPADWVAAHKPDANGVIKISTDYPDYIPFIAHADDDDLRKQLYIQFRLRGSAHNDEYMQKVLELRAEKAKLLGFANWADYQSDDKMLKGGKAAAAFIDRVWKLADARARKDYAELLAQLRTHDKKAKVVEDWQRYWLESQLKKTKYDVDSVAVRKYFSYDKVLAGLLDITSEIYDIQYKPVTDAKVWHPDVAVYDVMRGDTKLGRIYLDMHPRDGKYKHAAQFPLVDGIAGKQLPEGALVCNLPDPKVASPALMDHGDVVTMFHEFGHLMHHVLGGQHRWDRQSGVATEADFVEAPSQMFEEWGWRYETLSRFAKHVDTGETIPKELVAKMRRASKAGLGTQTVQQLFYASISLGFHQADPRKLDQVAEVKRLQKKYTHFPYVEGTKMHSSFEHLIGYSSMYYTYMWSLVIAKDLLVPFEQPGLLATSVTYKYRDRILAPGGTKDAADLVRDFLGRSYDFKAFERYLTEE
jgi:Zn-dependent oligopeptidase